MAAARDIEPCVMAMVRSDWERAPQGHKTARVKQWADKLDVDFRTLYAALPTTRLRKGERQIAGLEDAARVVAMYKFMAPDHRRQKVTEDAVKQAIENGKQGLPGIDAAFADVPVGTFDRVIRELNLAPKKERKERFQAVRPNQLHHIDGSTSDCFYIAERLADGDYLLKLHKGHKDYKNKPIKVDGLRPWLYGFVDDNSGCWTARYVAACGESAIDNIDFLCWAWSQDSNMPWFGIPERLMGDKGPMVRDKSVQEFLKRTGIHLEKAMPGNKEAHGKIEKIWDVTWSRFEANFFTGDWRHFSITLSELNRRYQVFQREWSSKRKHRFETKFTRLQVWERINLHGGAVVFPEDAIRTVARCWDRTLDQCGVFSIDGEFFEVSGLHSCKAKIYRGAFDGKLVALDPRTGNKHEVEPFVANDLDEFHGNKQTDHGKLREAASELAATGIRNMLHLEDAPAAIEQPGQRKVIKLKTRVKTREIDNPLNTDSYHTIDEALRDFQGLCGFFLAGEMRTEVARLIKENKLSKRFVAELAGEIQAEQMQQAG